MNRYFERAYVLHTMDAVCILANPNQCLETRLNKNEL